MVKIQPADVHLWMCDKRLKLKIKIQIEAEADFDCSLM